MSKLFLSYARTDDEPFVARLYATLTKAGFDTWWDRRSMPTRGLTFLQEIGDAIRDSERTVVVIGPDALASDYVRAEWQTALAVEQIVVPVLRLGTHESLPPELRIFHAPDARPGREESAVFEEIVRVLRQPIPPLGRTIGLVPELPTHFRPRPDDIARVANAVLPDTRTAEVVTGPQRVTVMHGMAGVGKSVTAATFARSTSTRGFFHDGIVWLEVGEHAEPLAVVRALGQLLHDAPPPYSTLGGAATALKQVCDPAKLLIVLDNVWNIEQVRVILGALGPSCRGLVTSRNAALAEAYGATPVTVSPLDHPRALLHLADWDSVAPESLPSEAVEVAKLCGGLPLALALNGATKARGSTWADLLEALQAAELDFASHVLAWYPHRDLLRAIKVSVQFLAQQEPDTAERFRELVAFLSHVGLPEAAVAMFWRHRVQLAPRHARKVLGQLASTSLVRLETSGDTRRVSMHDLIRKYLEVTVTERQQLEEALLAAYAEECAYTWISGPADGYFHRHLVRHLSRAQRHDEVHALLAAETPAGRNAWFEIRRDLKDIEGYLDDLTLASSSTRDVAYDVTQDVLGRQTAIGLLGRYALMAVSFNSLAELHPALVSRAIETNAMDFEDALAYARRAPDDRARAQILAGIAPCLSEPYIDQVLSLIMGLQDRTARATVVKPLAPQLVNFGRSNTALDLVESISTTIHWARCFQSAIEKLPAEHIERAKAMADSHRDVSERIAARAALAPRLSASERAAWLETTLEMAIEPRQDEEIFRRLSGVIGQLSGPLLERTLDKVGQMQPSLRRNQLHWALAERLVELGNYERACTLVDAMPDDSLKESVLSALARCLCIAGQVELGLQTARAIPESDTVLHRSQRWSTLLAIAPLLPAHERDALLQEAQRLAIHNSNNADIDTLADLLPMMPEGAAREELLGRVLNAIEAKQDGWRRAWSYVRLAGHLPDAYRMRVLDAALAGAREAPSGDRNYELLPALAPLLDRRQVLAAIDLAQWVEDGIDRAKAALALLPWLPAELQAKAKGAAISLAEAFDYLPTQAQMLTELVAQMGTLATSEELERTVNLIAQLPYPRDRVPHLAALLPAIRDDLRESLREPLLRAVRGLEGGEEKAEAIAQGLPWVLSWDPALCVQLFDHLGQSTSEWRTADILEVLLDKWPTEDRNLILPRARAVIEAMHEPWPRLDALVAYARATTADERAWAIKQALDVLTLFSQDNRDHGATTLSMALSDLGELQKAYDLAGQINYPPLGESALNALMISIARAKDVGERETALRDIFISMPELINDKTRIQLLQRMIPLLTDALLPAALDCARQIGGSPGREVALHAVVPLAIRLSDEAALGLWVAQLVAMSANRRPLFCSLLAAMAPLLARVGGELGVQEMYRSLDVIGRWWP